MSIPKEVGDGAALLRDLLRNSAWPSSDPRWQLVEQWCDLLVRLTSAPQSENAIDNLPEGCTPADARVLREANHKLACENHNMRMALRFYANGHHLFLNGSLWDSVSGEPPNLLMPELCDPSTAEVSDFLAAIEGAILEDGTIAKFALQGKPVEFDDPDDVPPPVEGEAEYQMAQEIAALDAAEAQSSHATFTNQVKP